MRPPACEAALPSSLADADEVGSRVMALNAPILLSKAQERQLRTGASASNAGMSSTLFRWGREPLRRHARENGATGRMTVQGVHVLQGATKHAARRGKRVGKVDNLNAERREVALELVALLGAPPIVSLE